jgi:hypothetical protein
VVTGATQDHNGKVCGYRVRKEGKGSMKTISLLLFITGMLICVFSIFANPFSEKWMLIGIFNIAIAVYTLQVSKS